MLITNPGPLKFHQGFVWKNPQIWPSNPLTRIRVIGAYQIRNVFCLPRPVLSGTEVNFEPNVALLAHENFGPSNPDMVELLTNPHLQTIPK